MLLFISDCSWVDTCTSWFRAAEHWDDLAAFVDAWEGPAWFLCLDLFGASEVITSVYRKAGHRAVAYDILLEIRIRIWKANEQGFRSL